MPVGFVPPYGLTWQASRFDILTGPNGKFQGRSPDVAVSNKHDPHAALTRCGLRADLYVF